jgi:hypothetical protein
VIGGGRSGSGYDDFNSTQNNPTIVYRYDGQMPIEEENFFANAGRISRSATTSRATRSVRVEST